MQEAESPAVPATNTDAVVVLTDKGVRSQLAQVVCWPHAAEGTHEGLHRFLLAWALLLAHILEMPAGDPGKTFLAQALRDEYE